MIKWVKHIFTINNICFQKYSGSGQWLSGRVLDSRLSCCFEHYWRHCIVSLRIQQDTLTGLVLFKPRKTPADITKKMLTGVKNEIKQSNVQEFKIMCDLVPWIPIKLMRVSCFSENRGADRLCSRVKKWENHGCLCLLHVFLYIYRSDSTNRYPVLINWPSTLL